MMDSYFKYIIDLYNDVPIEVYVVFISVCFISAIVLILYYGWERGLRKLARLFLVEYVILIFCSTVFFRTSMSERKYSFIPFESYISLQEDTQKYAIADNIMNVVVFVPVGLLLGIVFRNIRPWCVVLCGLSISLLIELLQFVLKKGFSQLDDVIHNTFGCILGFGVFYLIFLLWKKGVDYQLPREVKGVK